MPSCMECIHFNPCNMHGNIILERPTESNDFRLHNKVEDECKYFKNKADFVEVVRCGQCECYKEYLNHDTKEPTGWGKCNKIEMDIDLARNDFCCYGERKNT